MRTTVQPGAEWENADYLKRLYLQARVEYGLALSHSGILLGCDAGPNDVRKMTEASMLCETIITSAHDEALLINTVR